MELLLEEDGFNLFLIEFIDNNFEVSAKFNVFEVTSWGSNGREIADMELYLKGQVKWDGCSHIWFGDKDGYLHLCGKDYFDRHNKVMSSIWDLCSKKIKKWDNKESI